MARMTQPAAKITHDDPSQGCAIRRARPGEFYAWLRESQCNAIAHPRRRRHRIGVHGKGIVLCDLASEGGGAAAFINKAW